MNSKVDITKGMRFHVHCQTLYKKQSEILKLSFAK